MVEDALNRMMIASRDSSSDQDKTVCDNEQKFCDEDPERVPFVGFAGLSFVIVRCSKGSNRRVVTSHCNA